ncbi:hypothetical protein FV222_04820 [Methylobacterium sp. WL103]|uniref:hypothetical protein n=1 Tax=Methylobacterium sp. WL103 TaxID=2603891 RepID=UPI0011CA6491|nr:hypothetical protein [Methylobacterium sp. WL103]TXN06690.1 hypothetical protein FV222_04820 [Methylobacterium sp. WL103]
MSADGKRAFATNVPTPNPNKPPATIRGGFIIVRRDDRTGRLITLGKTPYEHASAAEARAQAVVMAERLGSEFAVFCEVDAVLPPPAEVVTAAPVVDPEPSPPPAVKEPAPRPPVVVERRTKRRPATGGRAS